MKIKLNSSLWLTILLVRMRLYRSFKTYLIRMITLCLKHLRR
nr:MAG TPA: hypothetical protein [Crassvirales sp.]